MFFKIIEDGHTTTFECKKVEWHPKGFTKEGQMEGHVIIDDGIKCIAFDFGEDCKIRNLELIWMNDNGKTIDRIVLTK